MSKQHIVVFSGAGISAESGLGTFRDSGGLWERYRIEDVATPEAWAANPQRVLEFYNLRREQARKAQPNAAHRALVELESAYEVTVVTQNVDDLHGRAGSSQVIHLHGQLNQVSSSLNRHIRYPKPEGDIAWGETCELGSQLRPDVVWFGETINHTEVALDAIEAADKILVVGTSLQVYPAAGFVNQAPMSAERVLVAPDLDDPPMHYEWIRAKATEAVPALVKRWLCAT